MRGLITDITKLYFCIFTLVLGTPASALACKIDISRYVGWTIIDSGTVTGYVDKNGQEQDEFEDCEYDRILIIDNDKIVTCAEYSYSYAYRPEIVVLAKDQTMEACIDDEVYDIR